MTSVARLTIAKARFFLDYADNTGANERIAFCNFLESAIVFTRSVTFHLQKEFANQPGFTEWYVEHRKPLEQNRLGRFLLEQRNYLLKEGPIATHRVIEMTMTGTVSLSCSATITVIRGAPWYKRSIRILWQDATYPLKEKLHAIRERRFQAKVQKELPQSQPQDIAHDDIYFSNDEWKSEPAVSLVRRLLDELETFVQKAESKFPAA